MKKQEKIWIVGASSGIGLELVKILLENNHLLIVSSRNAKDSKELLELKNKYQNSLHLINFDVTTKNNISNIIEEAWLTYDGVDTWVYNAGAYEVMGIEGWDFKYFEQMNNVNYLSAVRLMTKLLPYFKKQGFGKWIWNLSLSTYFGLPRGGGYSAPKAALLNLAQSIQPELLNENIKLQVINHGFVKTRLTAKNKFDMPQLMTAKYTAEKIFEAMKYSDNFEIRFPFKLSLFLRFLSFLPYSLSLAITRRMLK